MANKHVSTVVASTVGAIAIGDHAQSHGTAAVYDGPLTQERHRSILANAQMALVRDQDVLERIDERLYQAMGDLLLRLRKIEIGLQSQAELQLQMKQTVEDVWAEHVAKGMKSRALPQGLAVISAIAKHPATGEVVKKLLGA